MKLLKLSLILCTAAMTLPATLSAEVTDDSVIATVNGTSYPLKLFRLFYMERIQQNRGQETPELKESAFNDFMSLVVASQEALRRDLDQQDDVKVAIELQRMKVLSNATVGALSEEFTPSDEELQAAYEEVKQTASRDEYKARHILVADEEEAKKLITALEGGADFAELARENSLGPTGKGGGELDWFDASQTVAPFAEAVAAMEAGTYSKTPVQTQFGWHVIELQEVRKANPPTLDDIKGQLIAIMQREKVAKKMAELRDSAMVELNEEIVTATPREE